jgi:hypothetical protein
MNPAGALALGRTIALFAAAGLVGPLLIPLLLLLPGSPLYDPLYRLIAVLCPAWLLGPLEYSLGRTITFLAILFANVLIWSVFGAIVATASRTPTAVAIHGALLLVAGSYAYWITGSFAAALVLICVVVGIYVTARRARAHRA